jgi:hypothetical protein
MSADLLVHWNNQHHVFEHLPARVPSRHLNIERAPTYVTTASRKFHVDSITHQPIF